MRSLFGIFLLGGTFAGEVIGADPVLDWNQAAREAIGRATLPPGLAARQLAILHLSMWKAFHATGGDAAATSAAANSVCRSLFAGDAAFFDSVAAKYPSGNADLMGKAKQIANEVLDSRSADGSTTTIHYVPSDEPGQWRRTTRNRPPELPHWPKVTPFCMESSSAFRLPPPPSLDSQEYAEAWAEVKSLGGKNSDTRTVSQSDMAVFWSDFTYTSSPPGHWNEIAQVVAEAKGLTMAENARLFAILNMGLADAGIAAFDSKYHHNFWRPVTAIPQADRDGNEATRPEPSWKPFLATPSHPEYPSAHSVFSGAAAEVLKRLFGTDEVEFEVGSDSMPGVKRAYTSFSGCAQEISLSRIYGGIHYRFSGDRGIALGRKIGGVAVEQFED